MDPTEKSNVEKPKCPFAQFLVDARAQHKDERKFPNIDINMLNTMQLKVYNNVKKTC
jgi:hypothetical protein